MADKAKQEAVADSCFSDLTFANFIYSFGCMSIFNGFYKKNSAVCCAFWLK